MCGGQDTGDKDNTVYLVIFEQLQIGKLLFHLVFGVGKQQAVPLLFQHLGHASGNAPNGFRVDFGEDDADDPGLAGAQDLRAARRGIAGFFDYFPDAGLFLLTHVAMVDIAGNAGFGNTGALRNFGNCHQKSTPFLPKSSFLLNCSRFEKEKQWTNVRKSQYLFEIFPIRHMGELFRRGERFGTGVPW